jgi:signal transduction histidine kinase
MNWTRTARLGLALLILATVQAAAAPRRVLLLHAFGHAYSPWSDMAGSFRADLIRKSPEPIELYEVSLDTARVSDPQDERPFIDYIQALLSGRAPDLIVPVGAPAAFFVQRNRQLLFPATPMLIVGADARRIPEGTLAANETAVLLGLDLPAYLANILRLRPETTNVAVVVGNSPVERFWTSELKRDFQPFANRVNITWFNDLTFDEMLTHASTMPAQSALFYFLLSEDAAGVPYTQGRALDNFREVATAPIFGMGDFEMSRGIVGGPLMQTRALGQRAAEVALRILKGEAPSTIKSAPVLYGASNYDWRELQRWRISEALLPPGSIVHFREPTVWRRYLWEITAAVLILMFQGALITWLLFERDRRRYVELELRARFLEVMHLNRTATAGALSASFAHELNQPLGAILSNTEAAEDLLKADQLDVSQLSEILADIRRDDQRAAEIITHLGGLLKRKSQTELQEFDLNEAVRGVIQFLDPEASRRGVVLSIYQTEAVLPVRADQVHLQQVILNLAFNAMDAMQSCIAGTRRMALETVLVEEDRVEVSVADTGTGVPSDKLKNIFDTFFTTKPHGTGLGLSIARTIVETYGGKIWAENKLGGGAVFRFTLPLAKAQAA